MGGGTTEFLTDGAGVLVPPGDPVAMARAISRVLSDAGLRADVVAGARRRVAQRHDLSVTVPAMLGALIG